MADSCSAERPSEESQARKRVCKACDRCRLKKSKCDGGNPCGRCKTDDTICFFGERKRIHDKVYPKGYVEMLEQQQAQLVSGLQELYRRIVAGERWIGPLLEDGGAGDGLPRTHDILHQLGALRLDTLAGDEASSAPFEEDFFVLQRRLYESGAPPMLRHRSLSLESEADRPSPRGAAAPAAAASLRTTAESPDGHNSFPLTPPSKTGLPAPLEIPTTHATALRDTTSASSSSSTLRGHWPYVIPVMDFLDQYSPTSALEHVAPHGQGSCAGGGPCLGQEWQDEAEFKALFGDVVG
ncbi:MAG: hypothetical protein M1815_004395 [Lichina confinis]|nr:MAG: hypothetical protein M1815_004395 [Lichina confinis]